MLTFQKLQWQSLKVSYDDSASTIYPSVNTLDLTSTSNPRGECSTRYLLVTGNGHSEGRQVYPVIIVERESHVSSSVRAEA